MAPTPGAKAGRHATGEPDVNPVGRAAQKALDGTSTDRVLNNTGSTEMNLHWRAVLEALMRAVVVIETEVAPQSKR